MLLCFCYHFGSLSRADELLENLRQNALYQVGLYKKVSGWRSRHRLWRNVSFHLLRHESAVAEIMSHHDRRVQRRKVQRCYRVLVQPSRGFQNCTTSQAASSWVVLRLRVEYNACLVTPVAPSYVSLCVALSRFGTTIPRFLAFLRIWLMTLILWPRERRKSKGTPVTLAISM